MRLWRSFWLFVCFFFCECLVKCVYFCFWVVDFICRINLLNSKRNIDLMQKLCLKYIDNVLNECFTHRNPECFAKYALNWIVPSDNKAIFILLATHPIYRKQLPHPQYTPKVPSRVFCGSLSRATLTICLSLSPQHAFLHQTRGHRAIALPSLICHRESVQRARCPLPHFAVVVSLLYASIWSIWLRCCQWIWCKYILNALTCELQYLVIYVSD